MIIINARVTGYQGLQQIRVDPEGKISAIASMTEPPPNTYTLDVTGDWLSLPGVDMDN